MSNETKAPQPPAEAQAQGGGEVDYEFEVWQEDSLQAGGSTSDYATAKSEADHYALMYGQDGPVEVRMYEKRRITTPPSAPVGVEGLMADLETIWHSVSDDKETNAAYERLKIALSQQPASDGGFTAADMMDARQEGRKEGQQSAAVDGADAQAAEIEALRVELREAWSAVDSKAGWEWKKRAEQTDARAERLAEALRDIESRPWNGVRPIKIAARAALRDHDKEGGNP